MILMHKSFANKFGAEWPYEVAYKFKNYSHEEWTVVTYRDLLEKKIKRQRWELEDKRRPDVPYTKPGYIWVFNVDWFLFGGWYIYIKTHKRDIGITFRQERDKDLVRRIMHLFPMGVIPEYENYELWAEKFAKAYPHKGFKRVKNQGLYPVRCFFDKDDKLIDIELYVRK